MGYSLIGMIQNNGNLSAAPSSVNAFEPMPPSSPQDYYFKEKAYLQKILSAGHVLDNYYLAFSTTKITQADIDKRYEEYDADMGDFAAEIQKNKRAIAELNPATKEAKEHQSDTMKKLDDLASSVSEYKKHETSAKDTFNYLNECRQELSRLYTQGKMEF